MTAAGRVRAESDVRRGGAPAGRVSLGEMRGHSGGPAASGTRGQGMGATQRPRLRSVDAGQAVPTAADQDMIDEHLTTMRLRGLSEYSVAIRRASLRRLAVFVAPLSLLEVTAADLNRYQRALLGGSGLAPLAARSRASYVVNLRMFYQWAHAEGLVGSNPATVLVVPKVPKGRPHPIGEDELALALTEASPRMRAWLALAAGAGLRAMEIAGLRREDVVERAGMPHLVLHGKGSKTRIVPLSPWVLEVLKQYGMPVDGRLFIQSNGRPVTAKRVSDLSNDYLHRLGIVETIHKLRHRFATRLYRATKDLRLTQEMLGHDSPATTAIYAGFDNDAAAGAIAGLTVGAP
jgi:integrase/recombinase XerC